MTDSTKATPECEHGHWEEDLAIQGDPMALECMDCGTKLQVIERVEHARLQRMVEAGKEFVGASKDLYEWVGRSTLPLQRVERWLKALNAFEEASRADG